MIKVLMLGNDSSVKGGITTVINQIRFHKWDNIRMKFVPTYKDNNAIVKILFFIVAYIKIILNLIVYRPDLVHMHISYKASFTRAYIIHRLCKLFKIEDLVHIHGSEFKKWYDSCKINKRKKIKRFLRECGTVIVLGTEWQSRIKKIEPKANVVIVNNTVKLQRRLAKYNDNPFQILFLGVLIERKGVGDLLKAINIMKNEGFAKNIRFVIAGTGEKENELKKTAEKYNISEYVDFVRMG